MQAYTSLVYSNDYAPGAIVLGRRLAELDPARARVLLVTPQVSARSRLALHAEWTDIREVPALEADAADRLAQLNRPELAAATTKINVWKLTDYEQVVYLDADTLPLRPLNDLFAPLPAGMLVGASPDIGWPDIFNSGVFVFEPSEHVFQELWALARAGTSFDGSDQGLLNEYFHEQWYRLPFTYNVTSSSSYQYVPAFNRFHRDIRVYHFIGPNKPWHVLPHTVGQSAAQPHETMLSAWHEVAVSAGALQQVNAYETQVPQFQEEHLIKPAPDRWEPTTFPPPRHSAPEAPELDEPEETADEEAAEFQFPKFGKSVVQLPWEQFARTPERVFNKSL